MSAIVTRLLEEAKKIPEFAFLKHENSNEVVLVFHDVPTYDQQLRLQRVLTPTAERTTAIKVWGFSFEGSDKFLNIKL